MALRLDSPAVPPRRPRSPCPARPMPRRRPCSWASRPPHRSRSRRPAATSTRSSRRNISDPCRRHGCVHADRFSQRRLPARRRQARFAFARRTARRPPASSTRPASRSGSTGRRSSRSTRTARSGPRPARPSPRARSGSSSGLPLGDQPKPFNVRFPKAGSYTYYCDLHSGMKGRSASSARARRSRPRSSTPLRVKKQAASGAHGREGAREEHEAGGQHRQPRRRGQGRGQLLRHSSRERSRVPAGTTVTFAMPATLDGGPHRDVRPEAPPTRSPSRVLPRERSRRASRARARRRGRVPERALPDPAPASLSPTLHGNGFWNTGILDGDRGEPAADARTR